MNLFINEKFVDNMMHFQKIVKYFFVHVMQINVC